MPNLPLADTQVSTGNLCYSLPLHTFRVLESLFARPMLHVSRYRLHHSAPSSAAPLLPPIPPCYLLVLFPRFRLLHVPGCFEPSNQCSAYEKGMITSALEPNQNSARFLRFL